MNYTLRIGILWMLAALPAFGQDSTNCFLEDYEPKIAVIPPHTDSVQTTQPPEVFVRINTDTLGKVSKYILGNAVAVWVGPNQNNPTLRSHLQKLAPSLIRFPGGSWSDIYFWKGNPGDLPSTILDGNTGLPVSLSPQYSAYHSLTVDQYYDLRDQIGAQGLITINYGYARYGLSAKPAEQAAHYAADWVRYDDGRTKFWEIGNESGGPWEAGWMIDTTVNKDGQPRVITGELYGKHFKIFADSMRAAAAERGDQIYIGCQILHFDGTNDWNIANHHWNEGVFGEVGDTADFYVMHNYFGGGSSIFKTQIDVSRTEINNNATFIRNDIINKGVPSKPVAVTEWNCGGPDSIKTSIANGVEAVVLFCEMMKNNFGMSARWLVANWETDGMFYNGSKAGIPAWNPRPDYYYTYYLQRFTGDHMVGTTVTASPSYTDILAYATRFSSGEVGVVVVNKGTKDKVVNLSPRDVGVGERYYVYSLTGYDYGYYGSSQSVVVNGVGPTSVPWGPGPANLETIPAKAYAIGSEINLSSPAKSVQFVMIESGNTVLSIENERQSVVVDRFALKQNYPNPFNPLTKISYSLPQTSTVSLKVFDVIGREIAHLVNNERKPAGNYEISFDAADLPSGIYFYTLRTERFVETKKMTLVK
jgi:hypothetical protein